MKEEKLTIAQLQHMSEDEDHIEFKKCEHGAMSYGPNPKAVKPAARRKCILGYIVALSNEGGGYLVLGMDNAFPHKVVGTTQYEKQTGRIERDIYRDLGIRPNIYELKDENQKRVLVIEVPSRPRGQYYTFEDVPLMRVGESLTVMDQNTQLAILQETTPDFSETICPGVTIKDLDPKALSILKQKYARKQKNKSFQSLPDKQALNDLKLMVGNQVTNAAVLLVGKEEIIAQHIPQAKVILEYRHTEGQIRFDKRLQFGKPFFRMIDEVWEEVDHRNGSVPVQDGPYMFDIPFFNEEVIRELTNNAFVHRDYRFQSEIVIKQYPTKLSVISPGGFPMGVNLKNMLTVSSTPRNRLLASALASTGVVEKSGQGIDLIFRQTLAEGKPLPDYSKSEPYSVTATVTAEVTDPKFALFMQERQSQLSEDEQPSVFDVMVLFDIKNGKKKYDTEIAERLAQLGFLEKREKSGKTTFAIPKQSGTSTTIEEKWDTVRIWSVLQPYLLQHGTATKADILRITQNTLTERQYKNALKSFQEKGMITIIGERKSARYALPVPKNKKVPKNPKRS